LEKVIPYFKVSNDVSRTEVVENGEKFVELNSGDSEKMVVFSKAFKDEKKGSIEQSLVRESVKKLLITVSNSLPSGYKLVVWETYTPRSLHESLRNKKLTEEEMASISHMTGGAVDVSLADEKGNLLQMGTDLNHGAPQNKSTFYFEEMSEKGVVLSDINSEIRKNRRILYHAMNDAGFINNPLAWFHWDYGNAWWANATGNVAFYNAVDK
jgi:zinc D-Ala-D-Ala dipeptidase